GGHLYYNRAVNNIGTTHITNVYNRTVINNTTVNRVSYNGGSGGVRARPSAADQSAAHDRHIAATSVQYEHEQTAQRTPALRERANRGHPPIAATARPGAFSGAGVVPAKHAGTGRAVHSTSQPREPAPREQQQPRERENQPRQQPPQNERQSRPAQQPRPAEKPRPEEHSRAAERPPQHQEEDHEHH
ncbi:MAG TPA: hypothetical protein VIJ37_03250, partial [Steroidobacteraceae bacterium]